MNFSRVFWLLYYRGIKTALIIVIRILYFSKSVIVSYAAVGASFIGIQYSLSNKGTTLDNTVVEFTFKTV